MSRVAAVSAWERVVSSHLPHLFAHKRGCWRSGVWGSPWPQRCGQTSVVTALAPLLGQSESTVPPAAAGVDLRGGGQTRRPAARGGGHDLFQRLVGLGAGVVVAARPAAGAGARREPARRPLLRPGRQRALSRLRDSRGVGGAAGQSARGVGAPTGSGCCARCATGSPRAGLWWRSPTVDSMRPGSTRRWWPTAGIRCCASPPVSAARLVPPARRRRLAIIVHAAAQRGRVVDGSRGLFQGAVRDGHTAGALGGGL